MTEFFIILIVFSDFLRACKRGSSLLLLLCKCKPPYFVTINDFYKFFYDASSYVLILSRYLYFMIVWLKEVVVTLFRIGFFIMALLPF